MRTIVILVTLILSFLVADERYAFIYSKNIDDRFINFYDKVIVEADAVDNIYALRYPDKMVAYVSVGEIEPWRKTDTAYSPSWVMTENKTWHSLIGDLRKQAYQEFILARVAKLYKQGYRNFFLDTMDAYHVTVQDKKLFRKQQKALIAFIHQLHRTYPKAKLIINRGFEILDQIHNDVHAVVAESLLSRYNHDKKNYLPVPEADQKWLLAQFKKAQAFGLDAISIEYTDQSTKKRLEIAKKVKKLGILPYVTDGLLQEQGECHIERVRRDILILFNQSLLKDNNPVYANVHRIASMPLEYYGYVPILYDISTQELPQSVEDKYHAVVIWSNGKTKNDNALYDWTRKWITRQIPVLFLESFFFDQTPERLAALGIQLQKNQNPWKEKSQAHYYAPYKAYEMDASVPYEEELITLKKGDPILSIDYPNGQSSTPIALTPWGGYALNGAFLNDIGSEHLWTIDPFTFLKASLRLESIPVPDPTTEAGRRILLAHVDGDGFMEKVRFKPEKLAVEYLMEEIYKKYKIPHTLSVIQGEVDITGLYPQLSARMKKVAQELYRLAWIEPASHTFSHPFFWNETQHNTIEEHHGEGKLYHLPLKNYKFSTVKETKESVDFALSLAPIEKQSTKILFWSGDCLPPEETLAYIERQGIIAMNGGDTTIQKSLPWINHVKSFGLQHGAYWQVYTGQQNENVYTNNWLGPFWGYRNAIDTFEMTETPRRLKPINIYYHFYSGSKLASFNALKRVYAWAMKQKTAKLYASQYIHKVSDFYHTAIAKRDEGYEIRNQGYLKTVRFDNTLHADIANSEGVAGYQHHQGHTYVTLDTRHEHFIITAPQPTKAPYFIESNGWIESMHHTTNRYEFLLNANMNLEATFSMPSTCRLEPSNHFRVKRATDTVILNAQEPQGVRVVFQCR